MNAATENTWWATRGWQVRFVWDRGTERGVARRLRYLLSVDRWGCGPSDDHPGYQITRLGPFFIDRIWPARKQAMDVVNNARSCRYWADRVLELQSMPKPPQHQPMPALTVSVVNGEVVSEFTRPMDRLVMSPATALLVIRLYAKAVETIIAKPYGDTPPPIPVKP